MRLIHTNSGLFEEFIGLNIPQYAILSHTWEDEEVSFQDIAAGTAYRTKKGYRKVEMLCRIAMKYGIGYAWIDTCCIDKSSSAELSEAINSMYCWYRDAAVCYVYLSDLSIDAALDERLPRCRWLTRGWTLQELIAPRWVVFFDSLWNPRATKKDIARELSAITRISEDVLLGRGTLSDVSVAQKMSWAASRETTRLEDVAYCLLGIFGINMPLLYGEGNKAFRRLQEQIIQTQADFSIFAWRAPMPSGDLLPLRRRHFCGILADSPAFFAGCESFIKTTAYDWTTFSISNNGIKIQSHIVAEVMSKSKRNATYMLPLHCSPNPERPVAVRLRKYGPSQFVREDPYNLAEGQGVVWPIKAETSALITDPIWPAYTLHDDMAPFIAKRRSHALQIEAPVNWNFLDLWPEGRFDEEDFAFFLVGDNALDSAYIRFCLHTNSLPGRHGERSQTIECSFFAVGWSSTRREDVYCTLFNSELLGANMPRLQHVVAAHPWNGDGIMDVLRYWSVPKESKIIFALGRSEVLKVSYNMSLESDESVCQSKFWRISFSVDILTL